MPSQQPDPRGDRRAAQPEVKCLGRGGRGSSRRLLQDGAPAVAGSVRPVATASPASTGQPARCRRPPTTAHGRAGCRSVAAGQHGPRGAQARPGRRRARPPPGRAGRAARAPGAAARPGHRRSRCCRRPAARCASGPRPAAASKTSRRSAVAPALAGLADGLGHDVDAEHDVAAARPARAEPARAAADVEGGAHAVVEQQRGRRRRPRRVQSATGSERGSRTRRASTTWHGWPCSAWAKTVDERPLGPSSCGHRTAPGRQRPGAANAASGRVGARPVGVRRRCRRRAARWRRPTRRPAACQGGRGCRARSWAWTSGRRAAPGARAGVAQGQHPPPAVVGRAEHGVVRRRARAATSREQCRASSCGVSMPTWTTRPGDRRRAWACAEPLGEARRPAAARRSSPARPSRSSSRPSGAGEVAGEREVRSRPAPERLAAGGEGVEQGGRGELGRRLVRRRSAPSRVLTCPGPAPWPPPARPSAAVMRAPARSRGRPRTVPRTEPGHLRPGALGPGVVGRRRARRPATRRGGLLQQLDRVAEAAVAPRRARAGRPRRHTRIGAMSWTVEPDPPAQPGDAPARCRAGRATARRRAPTGRRRPTAMSARPERDVGEQGQQVGGVERAVAVHDRDVGRGRGQQPGVHGGAVARTPAR